MKVIYLDNHATTPVAPEVLEAMLPYFSEKFGNASSRAHPYGWEAEEAVEQARSQVATLINATSRDIIFTSGATESINLAIKGVAEFYRDRGNHIITAQTEHRAVLDCCAALKAKGYHVTALPVDHHGLVAPGDVEKAITDRTILISLMYANHEIGSIHDIAQVGAMAKANQVFFHTDATQAVGKIELNVEDFGIDLLSLSGHKIYGPKGVGALYIRRKNPRVRLVPLLNGGGHERSHRSGTLNVPGIVGVGKACEIIGQVRLKEQERLTKLRELLSSSLSGSLDGLTFNGHPTQRLTGNLNVSFSNVDGEALFRRIQSRIAVSSGASCTSAIPEPSYVLRAIGLPPNLAQATLRFGLGRFNTREDIEVASETVIAAVKSLREKTKTEAVSVG